MTRWERLKSRYILRRWWMNLREDHVRLPNGHEMEEYHVLEYPNWVCIVCLTENRELVMVEQYRYGIDQTTLELPGGVIDRGEDPAGAARRELLEESGFETGPENWTFIGKTAPDPSRHTHWAWIYFAGNAQRSSEQKLDLGEQMDVRLVPVEKALRDADEGRIAHGIHLAAIFWADRLGLFGT